MKCGLIRLYSEQQLIGFGLCAYRFCGTAFFGQLT